MEAAERAASSLRLRSWSLRSRTLGPHRGLRGTSACLRLSMPVAEFSFGSRAALKMACWPRTVYVRQRTNGHPPLRWVRLKYKPVDDHLTVRRDRHLRPALSGQVVDEGAQLSARLDVQFRRSGHRCASNSARNCAMRSRDCFSHSTCGILLARPNSAAFSSAAISASSAARACLRSNSSATLPCSAV
jgi:hypothetical protein